MDEMKTQYISSAVNVVYQSIGLTNNSKDSSNPTESILGASQDAMMISGRAKDIGTLYNDVKQTGDENAIQGFREAVQNLVGKLDNTDLNNLTDMGKEAVSQGKAGTFTDLLSTFHDLNDKANTSLGMDMVNTASKTYSKYGLDSAASFVDASKHVLNASYETDSSRFSTLKQFISAWQDISMQDKSDEQIKNNMSDFANKVSATDGSDLETYLSSVNKAAGNGSDISQSL